MTHCKKCGIEIEEISIYPHLDENLFKPGIDIADIPIEVLEDLPKPHLHSFYRCISCKYVEALQDIPLLSKDEELALKNKGYDIKPTRTISHWKEWLKNNKKGKL